ncbi:glycosyltransferase family 2 protein [Sphingomonas sp.]|jgi:cellulose synthase/poly-beta-1,6-N-acetylglucosamine synthase-like glycosyltransferase|uniref:glycosyltransferase family 2 protein n=1 Tax=Sphingomonas sp. TaxID=28214 RepID=UPI002D7EF01D|nr:glycosyltransferase family 2 protein [Sphingomonas sp.]HEU0043713.1 glycosyltransferase family 2 protein [Sphingomonas sp.]
MNTDDLLRLDQLSGLGPAAILLVTLVITVVVGSQNLIYLLQLATSSFTLWRRPAATGTALDLWTRQADYSYPVTILAPAFNEELSISDSVRSLLALNYPDFRLFIINDGSTDNTMAVLHREFALEPTTVDADVVLHVTKTLGMYRSRSNPGLFVIDKENGRKADAINCGLSYAQTPLVCVTDADSMIEPDGLLRAAEPFMTDDGALVAVGGAIRIANGSQVANGQVLTVRIPRGWIPRFQTIEYLRAFLVARIAASGWSTLTLVSGAFGVFRRSTLVEIGGYRHDTVGEDLEVMVRLHRFCRDQKRRYRVTFVPEIVCWTEAPATIGGLRNQRARWEQGALETIIRHRGMIGRRRYGRIGMVALPMMILEDVICPPLEVLGYILIPTLYALGLLAPALALSFLALSVLFGIFLSLGALIHEELQVRRTPSAKGLATLAVTAIVENLGYRQLNSAFRIIGMYRHLRKRTGWAAVPRAGFQAG